MNFGYLHSQIQHHQRSFLTKPFLQMIFEKTTSMAKRALSHSWISSLPEIAASDIVDQGARCTEIGPAIQLCSNIELQQGSTASFSALDIPSYRPSPFPVSNGELHNNFMFPQLDAAAMPFSPHLITDLTKAFGGQQHSGFSISLPQDKQSNAGVAENEESTRKYSDTNPDDNGWGTIRSMGFPFSLTP